MWSGFRVAQGNIAMLFIVRCCVAALPSLLSQIWTRASGFSARIQADILAWYQKTLVVVTQGRKQSRVATQRIMTSYHTACRTTMNAKQKDFDHVRKIAFYWHDDSYATVLSQIISMSLMLMPSPCERVREQVHTGMNSSVGTQCRHSCLRPVMPVLLGWPIMFGVQTLFWIRTT